MTKTIAIIEARMDSSRLPGKTLMDVAGLILLERVIERINLAKSVNKIVVATSVNKKDNPIANLCARKSITCFRGDEEDVLGRVYNTDRLYQADIIVQSGADRPFYDPEIIDLLAYVLKWAGYDYAANDMKLTFPEDIDAHVISYHPLEISAREARHPREREDTPRFIWNHPERFSIFNLEALPGSFLNRPDIRLTVDYAEDLKSRRRIYENLYPENHRFSRWDLIDFLDRYPDLVKINSDCEQKSAVYKP